MNRVLDEVIKTIDTLLSRMYVLSINLFKRPTFLHNLAFYWYSQTLSYSNAFQLNFTI